MAGANERTVQDAVLARLAKPDLGWTYVASGSLGRGPRQVLIEGHVIEALVRLNPAIAERPDRVNEILPRLRAAILAVGDDGLVASNRAMSDWLRGLVSHKYVGTEQFVPVRLIDFEEPRSNRLVVSDEVTYLGADTRRYDLVHFVNGFPLVTGEAKTPVNKSVSWLNGAKDIHTAYEIKTPGWFVPNVLSYATEGKDLRYGAIRQAAEEWLAWGDTTDELPLPGLKTVLRSVDLLLSPEKVLEILTDFTFFQTVASSGAAKTRKVVPRYPQVEAVEAIVARVKDPTRHKGLIWHHQGSGKTLAMAFAAAKLRRDLALDAPTIVVVLDRIDLYEQLSGEFSSAGVTGLKKAETGSELREMLGGQQRGVIVTTIFRFKDAGLLTERRNVVVMVDEAHRTQEGRLGGDMREALPNANFIGLTGTPVSERDRNTWDLFGHPDDPDGVLNRYSPERSIADGATLPVHVETRLQSEHIRQEALDAAYAELIEAEGLDEREAEVVARKAGTAGVWSSLPGRVEKVAADIVAHYRAKVAPLGLKAQVVVYDRALCVAYKTAIDGLLADGEESTVVMTVNAGKDVDPEAWQEFDRDRAAENALKDRFRDPHDPLCFLIVTAKLLTGFDAPIEGVLYLVKPLKAHNLFQAVTRTNRRYTHPVTGQEKRYGLVVDYVGLGTELAKALNITNKGGKKHPPIDVADLYVELAEAVADALERFDGIDRTSSGFETLQAAQERLRTAEEREDFAGQFLRAEALFEFLWPDIALRPYEADYRWLAKIYTSVQPSGGSNALLWRRLGAKTVELIAAHVEQFEINAAGPDEVVLDEGALTVIRHLGLIIEVDPSGLHGQQVTAAEVLDTIEARLRGRGIIEHPVYESLARRLDDLRRHKLAEAAESVEFLKKLLDLAKDLTAAVKADDEDRLDDLTPGLLPDPNVGALTQLFNELAPETAPAIIERIVTDIDRIVRDVSFLGWQESVKGDRDIRREIRLVLARQGLDTKGDVFDRAYAYVRENY
jgi:type I restriction enzyme, R subunit